MGTFSPIHDLKYHLVWCPKRRAAVLIGDIARTCDKLIRESAAEIGVKIESLEVMPDHVHAFVSADSNTSVREIVKKLKGKTANSLQADYPQLRRMSSLWSSSYYAGTVGNVSESVVRLYIENQKGK